MVFYIETLFHDTSVEDEENFSNDELESISSLNKDQFRELFASCLPVAVYGHNRNVSKIDLLTFLMKMRQGLSDTFLKVVLGYSSRQNVSRSITKVRECLINNFVTNNLGFNCEEVRNKEVFIQRHVTAFSNILYNPEPEIPRAILYPDCTYIKVPKSSHFRSQRQSYSYHKKYNLLKAGLVVAPDGFVVDVHGPYFSNARNNDAVILMPDMQGEDENNLRHWLDDGDIFVADRGYRDAQEFLENLNLNSEIPPFLPRGQRQFSTLEANSSRIITKTRWIVESRNGHLKSIFKFFRDLVPMNQCYFLGDYLKISCALINKFRQPIHMQDATPELAHQMLNLVNRVNDLQARVEHENLLLRVGAGHWRNIDYDNDLFDFPRLSLEYLRTKTIGTYQVNLAPGYVQDTRNRDINNELVLQFQQFEPTLIRGRIHSRLTNNVKHTLFIQTDDAAEDPIVGTYCTCKNGARTLGVCAHVASLLWYLGYARHENRIKYPSNSLLRAALDAANRNHQQALEDHN